MPSSEEARDLLPGQLCWSGTTNILHPRLSDFEVTLVQNPRRWSVRWEIYATKNEH